ncbi:L-threonine-O-3-phosphate decarboxylase [Skermanella stibiiresistens SB22]|uniref:threonine-phosphate decarboxylase n=1 Tax=Skermanella stibiiresistens SB22 TaxID=1385369 RepID=W9H8X5_9PROT|nr:threonine-phosphate decarboxylase CobD [Skermanella stibiiresistens]EWY40263.1 L-threonine-O-3-phosphate decarboxylase [Skermanella stibiiresistens SB22]
MGQQSYGPTASASIGNAPLPGSGGVSGAARVTDHGGGLSGAEARFGRPRDGWIDLSTGINPWPYPVPPLTAEAWNRLPDRAAHDKLIAAAAGYFGADPTTLVAAPGSQALIQAVPRLVPPGRVAILGFTYAEHARCWSLAGHHVTIADTLADAAAAADCVIVTNPNNPDGRRSTPADLLELAGVLAGRGGSLVVDEAFADVAPELSVAGTAGRPGLRVLRSFGKFFGLAGLRLGFALGDRDLMARLEDHLGPWAVAGPALEIGAAAMADRAWIATTRDRLAAAATSLDDILSAHGLGVVGGTDLYRLIETPGAAALFEHLGRHGILVRPFQSKPGWLRFGLPPDAVAVERLREALASFILPP